MKNFRFACCLVLSSVASTCFAQSNPVPFVDQPLVPAAVAPGAPGFSLTIHGAGFVSGSTVDWNGAALATTFVSAGKLTAMVPAANVSTNGTANITVVNPGSGGSSNPVSFTVTEATSSLVFGSSSIAGTTSPISLVTADFNHDGIADLAVIDTASNSCTYQDHGQGSIVILLGNGDGAFTKKSTLCLDDDLGISPQRQILAADLNQDGNVDLVIVELAQYDLGAQPRAYYGNGDGTFGAPTGLGLDSDIIAGLAVGGFYNNGQLSVADSEVDDYGLFYLYLLPELDELSFNNGLGTLNVGDFNGDGVLDVAMNGAEAVFLNAGSGNFTRLSDNALAGTPTVSGDFNGDGIPDFASPNGNSISVVLGNGDGTFTQKTGQPTSAQTNVSLITADVNGDGILDLAVIDSTNVVSIWLGNGDGTFQAPVDSTGRGDGIVAADFNGDGKIDLAVTNSTAATLAVLLQGPACGEPSQNSPYSGTYNVPPTTLPLVVTWTNPTAGCVLHYTTDGSAPTASSPTYPSGGLSIYSTTEIRVIAAAAGYNNSAIIGGKWTLNLPTCGNPSQNSPYSGTYTAPPTRLPLVITWTNPTSACVLHYTTDGSAPTASSPTYPSGGLSIRSTTEIRVIAAATGYNSSAITGGKWTIN